jgi:superfamily I DNA/RNA helicase
LLDTLGARAADIAHVLSNFLLNGPTQAARHLADWNAFVAALPPAMTLAEVLDFLAADDEADQRRILNAVDERIGHDAQVPGGPAQHRIRILTMHGAKGLSGKVVFIPSVEQGILPSFRAVQATGLLIEQRRLFYVSLTRAKAACIISHSAAHTGSSAFLLQQRPQVRLPRSQFLTEMRATSSNRTGGLTPMEAAQIMRQVSGL